MTGIFALSFVFFSDSLSVSCHLFLFSGAIRGSAQLAISFVDRWLAHEKQKNLTKNKTEQRNGQNPGNLLEQTVRKPDIEIPVQVFSAREYFMFGTPVGRLQVSAERVDQPRLAGQDNVLEQIILVHDPAFQFVFLKQVGFIHSFRIDIIVAYFKFRTQ